MVGKMIALLNAFGKMHAEAVPFAITLIAKRLKTSWQIVHLATKPAATRKAADVAATPYAIVVSMVIFLMMHSITGGPFDGNEMPLPDNIRARLMGQPLYLRGCWRVDKLNFDADGQLNVGLLFVAFNQDIGRQFVAIQERLNEEPMVDYITPEGGGYFFAPAASRNASDWVGSGLFA